jgi:hypothetical protein
VLNSRQRFLFSSYTSRLNWLCESSLTGGKTAGVKVTHSPPLKCTLRLREAIPPLLHTSSWCGTQSVCRHTNFWKPSYIKVIKMLVSIKVNKPKIQWTLRTHEIYGFLGIVQGPSSFNVAQIHYSVSFIRRRDTLRTYSVSPFSPNRKDALVCPAVWRRKHNMKTSVFWGVMLCILVDKYERSGETYGLNLQDEVSIVSLIPGPDRSLPYLWPVSFPLHLYSLSVCQFNSLNLDSNTGRPFCNRP